MSCNVHLKKKKIHMLIQITVDVDVDVDTFFFWKKHHFSPYILESQSIQSLHFDSSQFCPYYF